MTIRSLFFLLAFSFLIGCGESQTTQDQEASVTESSNVETTDATPSVESSAVADVSHAASSTTQLPSAQSADEPEPTSRVSETSLSTISSRESSNSTPADSATKPPVDSKLEETILARAESGVGREVWKIELPIREIHNVDVSLDGTQIVACGYGTGSSAPNLFLLDAESGSLLRSWQGDRTTTKYAKFSPDGNSILSGGLNRNLKLWEAGSGNLIKTLTGHKWPLLTIDVSPDGTRALSGSDGIRFWELATNREVHSMTGHKKAVWAVAFSPDGKTALSGSADETMRLWDLETGTELRSFEGHRGRIKSVCFSPDGSLAASCAMKDRTVRIWDVATGEVHQELKGHKSGVSSVDFSPDGRYLISSAAQMRVSGGFLSPPFDKSIRVWDVTSGTQVDQIDDHEDFVPSVVFMPEGTRAVSGSGDRTVRLWELAFDASHVVASTNSPTKTSVPTLEQQGNSESFKRDIWKKELPLERIDTVAVSPDGRYVVAGGLKPKNKEYSGFILDSETGDILRPVPFDTVFTLVAKFTGDGYKIVTSHMDKGQTLRIWDVESGEEFALLRRNGWPPFAVDVSPDGLRAISGSDGIHIWDIKSRKVLRDIEGHEKTVWTAVFSPDGKTILSGSWDETMRLWDSSSGKELKRFNGQKGRVKCVRFSPDAKLVASCAMRDEVVRVWDLETGEVYRELKGHTNGVASVEFSSDGQLLISGAAQKDYGGGYISPARDKSIRVWDLESGKQLQVIDDHEDYVPSVVFMPDGKRAVSGSGDKTVRMWGIKTN